MARVLVFVELSTVVQLHEGLKFSPENLSEMGGGALHKILPTAQERPEI